jgi:hypothetical protein
VCRSSGDCFFEKDLDTIAIDTLYNTVRAMKILRTVRKKTSMMTSRTYKEHAAKWSTRVEMRAVCLAGGLSLSSVNYFGARLGQPTAIDSRNIRH